MELFEFPKNYIANEEAREHKEKVDALLSVHNDSVKDIIFWTGI